MFAPLQNDDWRIKRYTWNRRNCTCPRTFVATLCESMAAYRRGRNGKGYVGTQSKAPRRFRKQRWKLSCNRTGVPRGHHQRRSLHEKVHEHGVSQAQSTGIWPWSLGAIEYLLECSHDVVRHYRVCCACCVRHLETQYSQVLHGQVHSVVTSKIKKLQ